jgi:hypothetical protein
MYPQIQFRQMKKGSMANLDRPSYDYQMFTKYRTRSLIIVLSTALIAYFLAMSFVQQTLALGNMTGANVTRANMTNATKGNIAPGAIPPTGGSAGDDDAAFGHE